MSEYLENAIRNFLSTFSFLRKFEFNEDKDSEQNSLAMQELAWRALTRGRVDAIRSSMIDSWFFVGLNGVRVLLPRYSMMTMRHCINATSDGKIDLSVENAHFEKMKNELSDGSLFLDVGASTGAICIPYAVSKFADIQIVAFEPSSRARHYLESAIQKNNISNIKVLPFAISDEIGQREFLEFPEDDTAEVGFLPETSRLATANEDLSDANLHSFDVEVMTLDSLDAQLDFSQAKNIVIKIDVQGFEDKVLLGAYATIMRYKPFLSIDIHVHPGTQVMTDTACIDILTPLGYTFERSGHVLLARA